MANNAKLVTAGKPKIEGAVWVAQEGTTVPTDAISELDPAFECVGYVSDEGMTNAGGRTSENIKAWGGNIVLSPQTEKTDTWAGTFIESLNVVLLRQVYGPDNVEGDLESGIAIKANEKELPYASWVIDMVLTDGALKRVVIARGKITGIEDVNYRDDAAVGFGLTVTAFPDNGGDTHHEYIIGGGGDVSE